MKKKLFLVACLVLLLCVSLLLPLSVASADFSDLGTTDIVNFNQLMLYPQNVTLTNGVVTPSNVFKVGDKVYIYFHVITTLAYDIYIQNDSTLINIGAGDYTRSGIFTMSSANAIGIYSNGGSMQVDYFNIINLTTMFGSGNEPNLDQCKSLFTTSYDYILSQPMFFGVGGFDYSNSVNYTITSGNLYVAPFVNSGTSKVSYDSNGSLGLYTTYQNDSQYEAYYLIDFGYSFPKGSIVTISANYNKQGALGLFYVNDSYYDIIYNFSTGTNRSVNYSFVAKEDFGTLALIGAANSGSLTTPFMTFSNFTISIYTTDSIAAQLSQAKEQGAQEALDSYAPGTNNYNAIYEAGRQQGINDAGNYTFLGLISAVVDTPINAVLNMLDFDLLGVNMKAFYLSLFTFCIIVFIVKLII